MAFDINGQPLAEGHCEVHPWNSSPYPCWDCQREADENLRLRQLEAEHWNGVEAQAARDSWSRVWLDFMLGGGEHGEG